PGASSQQLADRYRHRIGHNALACRSCLGCHGVRQPAPPEGAVSLRSSRAESPRLSRGELGLVSLAGGVWMLFNVGYILVVSFGPALLMSQGLSQRDAGFMTSLVSWTVIITIPLGGVLIDRVGHATTLMIASFAGLGLSAMLMPAAPSLALMTFIGAL